METIDIEKLVKEILNKDFNMTKSEPEKKSISKTLEETRQIQNTILSGCIDGGGVFATVDGAIKAAKEAQRKYFETSLERRKKIIKAIREQLISEVETIAQRALDETGMGNLKDKILKNTLAIENTPGVEDLTHATRALTGDNGLTLYEMCPYGVIGAVTPSTNPTETVINNAIGMLAAGNSVYFAPHPGAKETTIWLVQKINKIVREVSGIDNLIVTIANPSIDAAQEMMVHPDVAILVVTGGPGVVAQAMKSGKKVIGAGAGNPPTIVDETAELEKAARDIVEGASFDNNIPCIAEKNIIAVSSIADYLIFNMEKAGAIYIKDIEDIKKLEAICLTSQKAVNKKYVGKDATVILRDAGISFTGNPCLIVVEGTPEMPFAVEEMLMPVIPLIRVPDFDTALELALELEHGFKHTATIHSQNVYRLNKAARAMETSIFVKNGPSFAGLGFRGEGPTTFTIATPTGEGTTSARTFSRIRRCVLSDAFLIR